MLDVSRLVLIIYAVLMLVGGVMGYVSAKSVPSLIAGLSSGVLLGIAWFVARANPKPGLGFAIVVAIGLAVFFAKRVLDTGKFMPSGALCIVSVISVIIFVVGLLQKSGGTSN